MSFRSAPTADPPVRKPELQEALRSGCSSRSYCSKAHPTISTEAGFERREAEKRNRIGCPRRGGSRPLAGSVHRPRYCLQESINESSWSIVNFRFTIADGLGRCDSSPPSLAKEGDNLCFCAPIRPRQRPDLCVCAATRIQGSSPIKDHPGSDGIRSKRYEEHPERRNRRDIVSIRGAETDEPAPCRDRLRAP